MVSKQARVNRSAWEWRNGRKASIKYKSRGVSEQYPRIENNKEKFAFIVNKINKTMKNLP